MKLENCKIGMHVKVVKESRDKFWGSGNGYFFKKGDVGTIVQIFSMGVIVDFGMGNIWAAHPAELSPEPMNKKLKKCSRINL